MEARELTTLSCSALGSLLGGLLASPLGPWAAVGGATAGTTLGGYLASQLWQQFYLDLGDKLARARRLLEEDQPGQAAALLLEVRGHPRFAEQEQHFRAELEHVAGQVLGGLAERAEKAQELRGALEYCRQARLFLPRDAGLLWSVIRLAAAAGDPLHEDSGQLEADQRLLLSLDPAHAAAVRSLAELLERAGRTAEAAEVLLRAADELDGKPEFREDLLRWALRLAPADAGLAATLVGTMLARGAAREALELLDRPELAAATGLSLRLLRGKALHAAGEFAVARPLLAPLAATGDAEARLLAGLCAARAGDSSEAIALLSEAATDPVQGREAAFALVPLLTAAGELDLALNHLQRDGLAELPGYEALLRKLAAAFEGLGLDEKASRVYDLARDLGDATTFWSRFALQYREGIPVCLGRGATGRVLLGRRRADNLPVAIREAPAPFALGGKASRRFVREVELLSRLSHPNLVELLGHALPEGKCLLAMEYCSGGSLAAKRSAGPMLWPEIKSVMAGLCAALAFLGRQSPPLVHRNVKPSNVLFAGDGAVKLGDLALVRAAEGAGTSVVTSVKERSQAYLYLSPEAILGAAEVGVSADVYSVGCVLYHLLTGRPPFVHGDVNRQISAHFRDAPESPSKLAGWIPPALDRAVMRCLEKEADRRYSDLDELWAVLEKI